MLAASPWLARESPSLDNTRIIFEIPSFRLPTNQDGVFRALLFPGRYRFAAVAPGSGSLLSAQGLTFQPLYYPGTENLGQAESVDLTSGKDVSAEIRVTPVPEREIHVHLAIEGRVNVISLSGASGSVEYEEGSHEIRIAGLVPGAYTLRLDISTPIQHEFLKSIRVGEKPVTDVEVSLADRNPAR